MTTELVKLVVQVFGILVTVGILSGLLRLGYNYIEQALGRDGALSAGIRDVFTATLWIILIPMALWLLVKLASLIRFGIGIEQVVGALVRMTGGGLQ